MKLGSIEVALLSLKRWLKLNEAISNDEASFDVRINFWSI